MLAVIENINRLRNEQSVLLAQLAMWEKIRQQGIEPDDVDRMTFDPTVIDHVELLRIKVQTVHALRRLGVSYDHVSDYNPFGWPVKHGKCRSKAFNVAIMTSGERRVLSPMIDRPQE
jgi:hypothetical protein